jgi:hypothetical protein
MGSGGIARLQWHLLGSRLDPKAGLDAAAKRKSLPLAGIESQWSSP